MTQSAIDTMMKRKLSAIIYHNPGLKFSYSKGIIYYHANNGDKYKFVESKSNQWELST